MGSAFWSYAHDKLRWLWIFRPGPLSALVKGIALYFDDIRKDIIRVRNQYIVAVTSKGLLPGYAQSRAIPRTRYDSDAQHRMRVERAYAWHHLGGKVEGLPKILEEYGYPESVVHNCREEDPERWAHFELRLLTPSHEWGQKEIDAVTALANEYKPGRSVLNKISFALRQCAPLVVAAVPMPSLIMEHQVMQGDSAFPPLPLNAVARHVTFIIFDWEVS